jgi:hypothetical protein
MLKFEWGFGYKIGLIGTTSGATVINLMVPDMRRSSVRKTSSLN